MEYTKETALQQVIETLKRNGFKFQDNDTLYNSKCYVTIHEDHYQVTHYEEAFIEWMEWFSPDLMIYTLLGYLSFNDFIKRGYEK